jgi:putative membrane protein
MNLSHTVKVVGSVVLSAVMAGSMMPVTVFAQNNDENPTEKTETVYSVLNSDGSISDTIVSSWLHDEDGINDIKETLNLTDVKNIKSNEKPSKDGNTYTWNAKGNDVYYEGTGTKQLPVSVKLRYELDGQEMSAKDMEGKSGHLKLTISFTNNYSEVKNINGKSIVIHPSYLAGGMLNMSTGNFTNVKCESGKIVNDGTNEMLAFANIPGLNETLRSAGLDKVNNQLGISDDVTVEADVNNFDLGSIMVGMTNEIDLASELGEIGSVSELTDGIDQLIEADDQLIDGSKQLYDGTTQLKEGVAPLSSAYPQIETLTNAFDQLHDGTTTLSTGLNQYTAGVDQLNVVSKQNLYKLSMGATTLNTSLNNKESKSQLNQLVQGSQALDAGIQNLNEQVNGDDSMLKPDMVKNLTEALKTTNEQVGKLGQVLNDLQDQEGAFVDLSNQITKASENINKLGTLQTSFKEVTDGASAIITADNEQIKSVDDQLAAIRTKEINALNASIEALKNAANAVPEDDTTGAKAKIEEQINALESQKATLGDASSLSVTLKDLSQCQAGIDKIVADSKETLEELNAVYNSSKTDIKNLSTKLDEAKKSIEVLNGVMKQLNENGITSEEFEKKVNTLKAGVEKLAKNSPALANGVATLANKLNNLGEGLNGLDSGMSQAYTGITQATSQLSDNSDSLRNGAKALNDGTAQLSASKSKMSELTSGLTKLSDAVDQLNDGAQQLYEGNEQFKSEGLDQLKEKVDLGVGELETLQSVMNEIKAMNKEYASYSGAPEGATVTSRYVFRTKEESSK